MPKMLYTELVFETALYFSIIRRWHTVDPIATYILDCTLVVYMSLRDACIIRSID
jgi:hypothetical protein